MSYHYYDNWNLGFDWSIVCETCSLKELKHLEKDLDWNSALKNPNMTLELINRNKDKIKDSFYDFKNCSLQIILAFEDKITDFYYVSDNSNLSIDFLRRNRVKLNWYKISQWCNSDIRKEFECYISYFHLF